MDSVYEAAVGYDAFVRLAEAWHERVLADPVVSHAFSHGFHPEHTERLAAYWAEALGGPPAFSSCGGDESSVIRMMPHRFAVGKDAPSQAVVDALVDSNPMAAMATGSPDLQPMMGAYSGMADAAMRQAMAGGGATPGAGIPGAGMPGTTMPGASPAADDPIEKIAQLAKLRDAEADRGRVPGQEGRAASKRVAGGRVHPLSALSNTSDLPNRVAQEPAGGFTAAHGSDVCAPASQ